MGGRCPHGPTGSMSAHRPLPASLSPWRGSAWPGSWGTDRLSLGNSQLQDLGPVALQHQGRIRLWMDSEMHDGSAQAGDTVRP